MKKLTQILLKEKYTERMVIDFNESNQDLSELKLKELNVVKENLLKVIASLDDLNRSVNEAIEKEENKKENMISDLLSSYIIEEFETKDSEKAYKNNESVFEIKSKDDFEIGSDDFGIGLELEETKNNDTTSNENDFNVFNEIANMFAGNRQEKKEEYVIDAQDVLKKIAQSLSNSNRINLDKLTKDLNRPTKESLFERHRMEQKKKNVVSDKIYKAIEIANKYNIGIPYICDGTIIKMIEEGKAKEEEVMVPILNVYKHLIETRQASKEDTMYMISVIDELVDLEEILKSAILDGLFKSNMM